jgi:hypothetical protein
VVALLVEVVVVPLVDVVVLRAPLVVEVDDAEGEGVLAQAATVSATTAVATASAVRSLRRPFPITEAYAGARPWARTVLSDTRAGTVADDYNRPS